MSIYKGAYVNNSHITKTLYSKLRKYYSDGSLPPKEIIKIFFQDILKKMFLLLNPTAKVDIDCVGNNMETVKPFGKVPRTVSVNVERSFNAARSFVYGFTTGKMVVARLTDLSLTKKCLKSVTRMTQCSHCHGQNNLKPCAGYCKSVYAHCFASLMELEHVWDEYLTEMQNIAVKLERSFDIEGVTRELPYDISEGIMNYQQGSATASPKVSFQIFLRNVIMHILFAFSMCKFLFITFQRMWPQEKFQKWILKYWLCPNKRCCERLKYMFSRIIPISPCKKSSACRQNSTWFER